ncbi:PadR family transcriptional regulator [Bacillus sp. TH44]|nr:PadR family transcriptional regulator [Bacillus sp. TH44]
MNAKAQKYIPLTEATYYILLSLVKPMHGYGIMQMVEEMTNGEVKLGPGTLYGNTTKLLKEKLIVEVASTDRKKCYELTPFGREVLELEYNRLQEICKKWKQYIRGVNGRWRQRRYSNFSRHGV